MQQGSVLSPLLFVMVLEALSQEFRTACPWVLLYIDDLVIIDKSVEELCCTVTSWKINLENEGLRVKMKKTKVMFSGQNINMLLDSDMWPCVFVNLVWVVILFSSQDASTGCTEFVVRECKFQVYQVIQSC